jgi:N-acyl-D-amino-acid deacylase
MDYDLLIRGGTIVDGTGREAYRGDVAVAGGKIAALGKVSGSARRTVEADGRVVSPGFIDIHTHYDAQVLWDPMLTISPWHGVTTALLGNCGFGVAPTRPIHRDRMIRTLEKVEGMSVDALEAGLGKDWGFESFPEYLAAIQNKGIAINVAVMLGHTPLRLFVMGEAATEREATQDEIIAMKAILRDALKAGAAGFATSKAATHVGYEGKPVPSRFASIDEIYALADELGAAKRGIFQATIGKELFIDEFRTIAQRTGRPVTWTALLAGLALMAGSAEEHLAKSEAIAAEGIAVYPQVTPRPLNFEYQWKEPFVFESLSLFRPVSAADFDGKRRIYADPDFRKAFRERVDGARQPFRDGVAKTIISQCPSAPELEERTLADVAAERGVHMIDLALDLGMVNNLEARFRMPVANHNEAEVEPLLKSKCTVLGLSDAGAHASQLCDACLPTYLLARWVREKQSLSLEDAVRMLTSQPADLMGFKDRGRLATGMAADLVVFDPQTVNAGKLRRVHDLPGKADRLLSDAVGVDEVIVNGKPIRSGGRDAAERAMPGTVLRS